MALQLHNGVGNRLGSKAGRRRKRSRNSALMNEINVTPFVDVMLVLLIIFMVTAPLLTPGIVVDLPESDAQPLPAKEEPLEISIDSNGYIFISKTKIDLDEIKPKLMAISNRNTDMRIFIRGDKHVDYGRMMEVMNAINLAGFLKVALITEQPK